MSLWIIKYFCIIDYTFIPFISFESPWKWLNSFVYTELISTDIVLYQTKIGNNSYSEIACMVTGNML